MTDNKYEPQEDLLKELPPGWVYDIESVPSPDDETYRFVLSVKVFGSIQAPIIRNVEVNKYVHPAEVGSKFESVLDELTEAAWHKENPDGVWEVINSYRWAIERYSPR